VSLLPAGWQCPLSCGREFDRESFAKTDALVPAVFGEIPKSCRETPDSTVQSAMRCVPPVLKGEASVVLVPP
jgi:hypothetical protein